MSRPQAASRRGQDAPGRAGSIRARGATCVGNRLDPPRLGRRRTRPRNGYRPERSLPPMTMVSSRTSPLRARSDRRGPPCRASRRKLVCGPARQCVGGLAGGAASDTVPRDGKLAVDPGIVGGPADHEARCVRVRGNGFCAIPTLRAIRTRSRRGAVDASRATGGGPASSLVVRRNGGAPLRRMLPPRQPLAAPPRLRP